MSIFKTIFGIQRRDEEIQKLACENRANELEIARLHGRNYNLICSLKEKPPIEPVSTKNVTDWTGDDVANLRQFLKTETGQKFIQHSGIKIQTEMLQACNDPMHTTHSAAKCAGADALLRWQFNLASDAKLSQVTSDTGGNHNPSIEEQDDSDPMKIFRPESV